MLQVTDSLQEEDVSANAALSEALRSIVTAVQVCCLFEWDPCFPATDPRLSTGIC